MARTERRTNLSDSFVSEEFIDWAEGLTGFLAQINLKYGGVSEMVEHPAWDNSRNAYAVSLLTALTKEVGDICKELKDHVHGYQKNLR